MNPNKTLDVAVLKSTVLALAVKFESLSKRVGQILATDPLPATHERGSSAIPKYVVNLPKAKLAAILQALQEIETSVGPLEVIGDRRINWVMSEWQRISREP